MKLAYAADANGILYPELAAPMDTEPDIGIWGRRRKRYLRCQNNNTTRKTCASTHYVRADFLEQVVLADLKRITRFAKKDEEAFAKVLMENIGQSNAEDKKAKERQLDTAQSRIKQLDMMFRRIYEDSALGDLSRERALKLTADYEAEQAQLTQTVASLQDELAQLAKRDTNLEGFKSLVRKHAKIRKLNASVLNQLVDFIKVYQAERFEGCWVQRIDIFYNCVGEVFVPDSDRTPEPGEIRMIVRKGVELIAANKQRAKAS